MSNEKEVYACDCRNISKSTLIKIKGHTIEAITNIHYLIDMQYGDINYRCLDCGERKTYPEKMILQFIQEQSTDPYYYHNGNLHIVNVSLKLYNINGVSDEEVRQMIKRIFSDTGLMISSFKSLNQTIISRCKKVEN